MEKKNIRRDIFIAISREYGLDPKVAISIMADVREVMKKDEQKRTDLINWAKKQKAA